MTDNAKITAVLGLVFGASVLWSAFLTYKRDWRGLSNLWLKGTGFKLPLVFYVVPAIAVALIFLPLREPDGLFANGLVTNATVQTQRAADGAVTSTVVLDREPRGSLPLEVQLGLLDENGQVAISESALLRDGSVLGSSARFEARREGRTVVLSVSAGAVPKTVCCWKVELIAGASTSAHSGRLAP